MVEKGEDQGSHVSCRNLLACLPSRYWLCVACENVCIVQVFCLLFAFVLYQYFQSSSNTAERILGWICVENNIFQYLCASRGFPVSHALTTSSDIKYDFGFPSLLLPHSLFLQALALRIYSLVWKHTTTNC